MIYESIAISDFCKTGSGGTPSRKNVDYYKGTIPWIKSGELKGDTLFDSEEKITEEAIQNSSAKIIPKNAILMAMYGATIGQMAILGIDATTNQAICNIIPDNRKADNRYVFYALQNVVPELLNRKVGGGQPNISQAIIKETKIPLPPIETQKRIVLILDKAKEIRRKRARAIDMIEEFLKAVFLDMFGDPATNPRGWKVGTIRDIVSEAKYGTSKKASETKKKFSILRMNNITYQGHLDLRSLKYIELTEKEEDKYLARKGDLLFNRTNSKELVGKTAVYSRSEAMALAGYLIRVRPNEKGNSYYLSAYLNSKHGKATLLNMCKSIVGMANINAQELQDIKILLPPVKLQEKFARIVQDVEYKKKRLSLMLEESDFLFRSLTQKAFRGEL